MKPVKLPTYPENLPPTSEVRDYDIGGGRFARVIMELSKIVAQQGTGAEMNTIEHWAITAQCYEMNADGTFKQAPNGFPSRSNSTVSTMPGAALNMQQKIDDGWVMTSMTIDPNDPPEGVKIVQTDPDDINDVVPYGTIWHNINTSQPWTYVQGWADQVAETKVKDLLRVLATSTVRSGMGFRQQQGNRNAPLKQDRLPTR